MKKFLIISLALIVLDILGANSLATPFQCEKVFSQSLQVNQVPFCNSEYDADHIDLSKVGRVNYDNQIYNAMLHKNNLGGIKVVFPDGKTKIVYRSAYLVGAPLCIHALSMLGVKTVINLYSGNYAYAHALKHLEKAIFNENGVPYYIHDHSFNVMHVVDFQKKNQQALNSEVVKIIGKIRSAKGNVLIHCYVGEHESAIIFGVLNKCYNHQSIQSVNQDNYCHSPHNNKFFDKAYNSVLKIVDQFPCASLQDSHSK